MDYLEYLAECQEHNQETRLSPTEFDELAEELTNEPL